MLLEINGQSLSHCTLSDAVHLLQEPDDLVTLKISKETQLLGQFTIILLLYCNSYTMCVTFIALYCLFSTGPRLSDFNSITYTVELPKDKGNLGISIRGKLPPSFYLVNNHNIILLKYLLVLTITLFQYSYTLTHYVDTHSISICRN